MCKPKTTVRERDSTHQIRVHINDVAPLISALCEGRVQWKDAANFRNTTTATTTTTTTTPSTTTASSAPHSMDEYERRASEAENQIKMLTARIAELEKSKK